jgi:PAS domain S-box-containing protein
MALRTKLLLPLMLAVVPLAAAALVAWPTFAVWSSRLPLWLIAVTATFLVIAAVNTELFLRGPFAGLDRAIRKLSDATPATTLPIAGSGEPESLAASLEEVRVRIQECQVKLEREIEQRRSLEESLRQAEERYQLAVGRTNDGIWEWDIKKGGVLFSPRWRSMLGYFASGMKDIGDWRKLIHPDDGEAVLMRMQNHLEGLTPNFEAEYRLRHADGHYRWVHSRGTGIRHADGKPYRLLMMDQDIHSRRQLEETLIQAAEGLSSVSGDEFYRALMRSLSAILGTRDNLVCQVVGNPPQRARTLAYYSRGEFWENFEYELEGTSCGAVIARGETVYCPTGVSEVWPEEKQYDRDSYIGVPMFDSGGKIIGHFACMDGDPMRQDLPHLAIFKIFSVRAAAELERTLLKQQLGVS